MNTVTTTARFRIRVYKGGKLKGFVASGPRGAGINRLKVHAIEYHGYDRAEQCANSWRDANPGYAFSVTQITTNRTRMLAGALLVASLAAWQPASACEAFGECTARAVMQEQQDRAQQARMDQLTQDNQRLQTEARDAELRSVLGIDPWSSPRR